MRMGENWLSSALRTQQTTKNLFINETYEPSEKHRQRDRSAPRRPNSPGRLVVLNVFFFNSCKSKQEAAAIGMQLSAVPWRSRTRVEVSAPFTTQENARVHALALACVSLESKRALDVSETHKRGDRSSPRRFVLAARHFRQEFSVRGRVSVSPWRYPTEGTPKVTVPPPRPPGEKEVDTTTQWRRENNLREKPSERI